MAGNGRKGTLHSLKDSNQMFAFASCKTNFSFVQLNRFSFHQRMLFPLHHSSSSIINVGGVFPPAGFQHRLICHKGTRMAAAIFWHSMSGGEQMHWSVGCLDTQQLYWHGPLAEWTMPTKRRERIEAEVSRDGGVLIAMRRDVDSGELKEVGAKHDGNKQNEQCRQMCHILPPPAGPFHSFAFLLHAGLFSGGHRPVGHSMLHHTTATEVRLSIVHESDSALGLLLIHPSIQANQPQREVVKSKTTITYCLLCVYFLVIVETYILGTQIHQ